MTIHFFFNLRKHLTEKKLLLPFYCHWGRNRQFAGDSGSFFEKKLFHDIDEKFVCKFTTILQIFTTI